MFPNTEVYCCIYISVISHISSFHVSVPFFPMLHFPFCFQGFYLSILFPLLLTFCSILISILPYFPFQTPLCAYPLVFLSVLLFHLHSYHQMPWYWYHKHLFIPQSCLTYILINPSVISYQSLGYLYSYYLSI